MTTTPFDDSLHMRTLEGLRSEIDLVDAHIVEAIGRRFQLCRDIARLKKEQLIPMMQPGRIETVRHHCAELCARHHVSPALVEQIYRLIIDESCRVENEIIGVPQREEDGREVPL
jgi:chorismate mutase